MKKIDTNSSNYQIVKGAFGFVGGLGSMICLDSVALTFVRALFPKSKFMNLTAMVGCVGLNAVVSAIGLGGTEAVVDQYAAAWNNIADLVNVDRNAKVGPYKKEEKNDEKEPEVASETVIGYKIQDSPIVASKIDPSQIKTTRVSDGKRIVEVPSKNAPISKDEKFVTEIVAQNELFTFKTEEEAQKAFEGLKRTADVMGWANIPWYAKLANKNIDTTPEGMDLLHSFGWKKSDLAEAGVDKIYDNEYLLDIFKYHDISDVFEIADFTPKSEEE